jgi:heterodisulfide reductase subunit B
MESLKAVLDHFHLTFSEVEDWNCCGATAAHSIDHTLSLALPSRILNQAAQNGTSGLLVPCAACYNRLRSVQKEIKTSEEVRKKINGIIGQEVRTPEQILNIVDYLTSAVVPLLNDQSLHPFSHTTACYYGCLLVRPGKVSAETRIEDPQGMDEIMRKIGATPIEWAYKTECCGAGFSVSKTDTVARLSADILTDAVDRGAEAIIVACPMCHSNLDMRRRDIEKYSKRKLDIPILYITQAIGLALGIPPKKLGLQRHFVPVKLN